MSSEHRNLRRRIGAAIGLALAAGWALAASGRASSPRFYPDDPITRDNDREIDAAMVAPIPASNYYDFIQHSFFGRGDRRDIPAMNVNTLGEVPDSSWFTNRIGVRDIPIEELRQGPNRVRNLSIDGWPIVEGKSEGRQPGFRVADPSGHLYQVEFDPIAQPEMATGAEIIGTLFYHAFGYNVVEAYVVEVDPSTLKIDPAATIIDPLTGELRKLRMSDIEAVIRTAPRTPSGRYRALATRFADGKPLGHFTYFGTRPDDPNDIFPHEHRRELRGNRVFAAWLNHDDSRGINSLDMLVEQGGRRWVKHYMFDFGSILGSGTVRPQEARNGYEYMVDWGEAFKTLGTFGLYLRPWLRVSYPQGPPSVGQLEAEVFDPAAWKPEYPNPAFDNLQPEDAFWAARIVAKFDEPRVRAIVEEARYSADLATDMVTRILMRRREKVLHTWLTAVNPLADFRLQASGELSFVNEAVEAGIAAPATGYEVTWARFDNASGTAVEATPVTTTTATRVEAPLAVLAGAEYVQATIATIHPDYPRWRTPVRVYFRRSGDGWQTVGIDRR